MPNTNKAKITKTKSKSSKTTKTLPTSQNPRRLKAPPYKPFRLRNHLKSDLPKLPNALRLFGRSLLVLQRNWQLFLGVIIIYALLNLILVHGLASNGNLVSLKSTLSSVFKGSSGTVTSSLTLFAYLLGGSSSTNSSNADAGVYQTFLIVIVSLVLIWDLRQIYNSQKIKIRDGFYKGIYPLVQFILVLLVIGMQLLPLVIGGFLYSTVIGNGIAVGSVEKMLWGLLFFILAIVSLYMICSSVFALYIVTLPDMTPMKALRSARQLVRYRRFIVLRKLLFLIVALLIITSIIMLPILIFLTPIAEWLYFALTMVGLAVIHSYIYALYREMLPNE